MLKAYTATDVGKVRSANEDALAVLDGSSYVVADGMGGCAAGEVASRLLVEEVRRFLADCRMVDEAALREAVGRANAAILQKARDVADYRGMGTTATLLHCAGHEAIWAHVGDSRLYLLRQGGLRQVTRDHSYVEGLVERGTITEAEARRHPRKNVLTRAVGVMESVEVDAGRLGIAGGDVLLLCTDGLTNMVADEDIRAILQEAGDPAKLLVEKALAAGGMDNVTAVVVRYDEE